MPIRLLSRAGVLVSKSRRKKRIPRPNGRPRRIGPTVSVPPSPSPVAAGATQELSLTSDANNVPEEKPSWYLPPDSKVRPVALNIMAMRAAGKSDEEIAAELKISIKSISPYVYRAAKNGWITAETPADRLRYELLHKTIDRLSEGLEDGARHATTGMRVRTTVALELAKGTVLKEFDQAATAPVASTVVAVQVVMPSGPAQQMRDDTIGGTPLVVEGQVVNG
jgi:hypothetical protein